ncbi:hypothetical protein H8356DRAFT_1732747 [Neocallimastix lanati (nom. inval.)]|jgi:hypothetical protein|nr:hypothetical protein H8356DRAFT_1732747 [Neocallimastix sp. JGI-2020a]
MSGLLNLNYYSDDESENEDNQESNNSSNTLNTAINTDSPGLLSLVNYNNDDDDSEEENTDNNSGDVIIYNTKKNTSHKKRKISDSSVDKTNGNSPRPKKANSLFASLIRRKVNTQQKQKSSSKLQNNSDNSSDIESGANPSLAITQLINNTLNNENSSLKVINLHDPERTLALKKRIADLLNPPKSSDKIVEKNLNNENNIDNDSKSEKKNGEITDENKMDIDSNNNNDNNNSNEEKEEEVKLNLEEYGLPKEVDTKCDQELLNRFSEWRYKKSKGLVFDKTFEKDSALEDPFIIRNLIDSLGIKEIGSNFSKDRFDPTILPKSAHYKELYHQNTKKVQVQTVQVPIQLPNQGGTVGVMPGIQFVPSNTSKTSGIDLAEVSAKIQQQIKNAAAKAAAATANANKIASSLSSAIKQNNIPITITNSINTTTNTLPSTGHVKKSKWDMQ